MSIKVNCPHCMGLVEVEVEDRPRTNKQNSAMWKLCDEIAKALNDAGYDMQAFPWKEGMEIPFSKYTVMESLYRPVMKALTGEESTTKQSTVDPSHVYEALMRGMAMKGIDIQVEWPSLESQMMEAMDGKG